MPWMRNYHDEWVKERDRNTAQVKEERESLTEEEKTNEDKKTRQEINKILEMCSEREKMRITKPNPLKTAQFKVMIDKAKIIAEYCDLNICIEWSENSYGFISLETDFILLDDLFPADIREIFGELYLNSSSFSICHKDDTFVLQYVYCLFNVYKMPE